MKKYLAYAVLPVMGLGLLGAGIASAHGIGFGFGQNATPQEIASRQQTMFQNEANLLGISVDEVKSAWAQGKTIAQIAQDHGITQAQLQQKMQDTRLSAMKTRLQAMVEQGVITQAQADQRLQFMQSRWQNAQIKINGKFHGGRR